MKFNFNMLKDDKKSSVDYWKLALVFFVIALFGLLAYEFSPFFDHRVALAKVQASREYMTLYNSLANSIGETQSLHVRKLFIFHEQG